jgi:hypothetical protein
VGLHLFRSSERPSEDRDAPALAGSLDLDRQGIELSAGRDWQWSGGRLSLASRALWNQIDPDGSAAEVDQRLLSLGGTYAGFRRLGPRWTLRPGLAGHYEVGETEVGNTEAGDTQGSGSWARFGGTARLGIAYKDTRLALSWRRDASRDAQRSFDLFQLGGSQMSLLPESALSNRIAVPALPVGTLLGEDHEGQRAELDLSFLPAPVFYERHRLWGSGQPRGDWLSLAGLEYRFNFGPLAVGRLPVLDLRVGVARILDDPNRTPRTLEDDTRWWLITVWRP